MDWTTLLKAQQADFINRLKSGQANLIRCETEGCHSEWTAISPEKLVLLRDFCWEMVRKQGYTNDPQEDFRAYMKWKLGEEVIAARLSGFVAPIDYQEYIGAAELVDFKLISEPTFGVKFQARHGDIDTIQWLITQEEVEKNAVLACILILEPVNEIQTEYNLILAGFLPTSMIRVSEEPAAVPIADLLYAGGLRSYVEFLQSNPSDINDAEYYQNRGDSRRYAGDYQGALEDYNRAIQLNLSHPSLYNNRGTVRYKLGDYGGALEDYNWAIQLNPYWAGAYYNRGLALYALKDYHRAIEDYSWGIELNADWAGAYYNRGNARAALGDYQGAIEDYNQAIQLNPNYAKAYRNRGLARSAIGDTQGAEDDFLQSRARETHDIAI